MKILIIAIALLAVLSSPTASPERDSLSWDPDFSLKLKRPVDTEISPNGKYIAYVVREAVTEGEKSEFLSHIHVAAVDGSFDVQYTRGDHSCTSPAFSPDNRYLAFLSSREEKQQVWLMRVMGGEARKITNAENGVSSFQWSPDGKKIAFIMTDPETQEEKEKKKEKRDVEFGDRNYKFAHLYCIELKDESEEISEIKQLTSGQININQFDWSPDGSLIVFSHQPDPTINTGMIESDISMVPSDSGTIIPLVKRPGVDDGPVFSPNGKKIAFGSHGGNPEPVGLSDIWIVSLSGGEPVKLLHTPDRNSVPIAWSKDGKFILASGFIGSSQHLIAIPEKGEFISVVTLGNQVISSEHHQTPENSHGVWSSFSISENTWSMSYIYQEPEKQAQVYYTFLKAIEPIQISHVNKKIELPPMAKTELIHWESKDGRRIEGLVTWPLNYQEGESYPVILNVHGGPSGVFTQGFTGYSSVYNLQYFAEKGYIILRPNPRGSTGYGKDFRYANVRDWGFGDLEDLLSGLDKLIEDGAADKDNQYIMGWSYGGYMTSFMVTRTRRFKAASMGAGLPNLISMTTTTDIPDYLVAHMGGREFWDDYETYEKHSAVYRLNEVSTPTQVIHGQNDLRVPFDQGREFYMGLKRKGIPTEMIILPRTPHGPREPKLQTALSPLIHEWFQTHKQPD